METKIHKAECSVSMWTG